MIRIYTAPSCASCRKVKSWLNENQIPYVEKNIFSTLLKESELRELLERSENGTDDIISKRSKRFCFLFLIGFQNYFLLFVPTKSRQKTRRSGPIKRTRGGCFYNSLPLKQVKTFFRLEAFYKPG